MASPTTLFTPLQVGDVELAHRVLMAPLTRCRAGPTHTPNALMAEHYAQRASAGLIITESTMVAPSTSAYSGEPGLFTLDQAEAWKAVTDTVHKAGGKIFVQLWHAGRAAHPDLNDGVVPIGASPIAIDGAAYTAKGESPYTIPTALMEADIPRVVKMYATAAKLAVEVAGFDGVEVQAANGCLADQFLRSGSNTRSDRYGGSSQNRTRFLAEVVAAVTAAVGTPSRVGLRVSPLNSYNSMEDEDPIQLCTLVAQLSQQANLAYVHVIRRDFYGVQKADVLPIFRAYFHNVLIANMAYTKDEADEAIAAGQVDAVAFGAAFLANPDLPKRFQLGAPLNKADESTYYEGGATGYTDYPTL